MTIEAIIIAKFASVFAGRMWWDSMTPADLAAPFCIVQAVGGEPDRVYVDNSLSQMQHTRLQFSVWGRDIIEVSEASKLLRNAILDANTDEFVTRSLSGAVGDYNEVLDIRGRRQDFGFWYIDALAAPP